MDTQDYISPTSEASREVANLTERINLCTPVYGVKEFLCPSVTNFDPNYLRTDRTEWAEIYFMPKTHVSKKFWQQGSSWAGGQII